MGLAQEHTAGQKIRMQGVVPLTCHLDLSIYKSVSCHFFGFCLHRTYLQMVWGGECFDFLYTLVRDVIQIQGLW